MIRFQLAYVKCGAPLTCWSDSKDNAHKKAEVLRKFGYIVDVWAHTKTGAHRTDL